jgi:endogenous inhibitor of DNA gyrase (YacG/DUF329 family)
MPNPANDNRAAEAAPGVASARLCPMCGKPQVHALRPFCSKRCADVDLGRWLGGRYAIAAESIEGEEERDGAAHEDEG